MKKKGDELFQAGKSEEAIDVYTTAIICWWEEMSSVELLFDWHPLKSEYLRAWNKVFLIPLRLYHLFNQDTVYGPSYV